MRIALAILSFSLLILASPARAEFTEFWFCFPSSDGQHAISVQIIAEENVSGTLEVPGSFFSQDFDILAGGTEIIALPSNYKALLIGQVEDAGVHVVADGSVRVVAMTKWSFYSGDAHQVRPLESLGMEYVVCTYTVDSTAGASSQFAVVGTEDGTTVTLVPSSVNDAAIPPLTPFQFSLNEGEVFQLSASSDGQDLTGSIITSTAPVAVVAGNALANVPANVGYADYIADMLPPTSAWGREFGMPTTQTRVSDRFRVIAATDGTNVVLPGSSVLLDRGGFYEFTNSDNFSSLSASQPVMVVQFIQGANVDGAQADPSMMVVPPRNRWTQAVQVLTPFDATAINYIEVITSIGNSNVNLDGSPISPTAWVNSGNYQFAVLSTASGAHAVDSPDSLTARAYGLHQYWSYGYYSEGVADTIPDPPPPPDIAPQITSILDTPNDQGRRVRIEWSRCIHDTVGSLTPITNYSIYRRYDPALAVDTKSQDPGVVPQLQLAGSSWDYVTQVPAFAMEDYSTNVPTLADSTIDEGMYWSWFMVRAATAIPSLFFDSLPDSGYSVDNLVPAAPSGLMVAYRTGSGNKLQWEAPVDADFRYFRVYRGDTSDFEALPGTHVAGVVDPSWTDPLHDDETVFYKISAVDFSGNESPLSGAMYITGIDDLPRTRTMILHDAVPNPFNPSTTLAFELVSPAHVRLDVFDLAGRLVASLVNEARSAGPHRVIWNGTDGKGHTMASGVYLYQLRSGALVETKRMVLLK